MPASAKIMLTCEGTTKTRAPGIGMAPSKPEAVLKDAMVA